jgi:pimeloyl-ACP methyl ester carboxylesterase
MNKPSAADLRGAARLATEATAGLTDLVEAMHQRIARLPGTGGALDGRTTGITGLVYRSVRGVTRLVGGSVDALLSLLAPAISDTTPGPRREALVAALNGVLGDHLAATANPLAITMAVRREGRALALTRVALAQALPEAGGTLVLAVHGLCMNDLQWRRDGHDQAAALAAALGGTAVYLHYNSGRPVAENGRELAALLPRLLKAWPVQLRRVVLLGHSMGGLVARSALHQAGSRLRVDDLVCLGTPHHGAPLERAGHGVDLLLGQTPWLSRYAAPLARLGQLRSAGITDLRHGHCGVGDEAVPLPAGVRCHAIAATLDEQVGPSLKNRLVGDGLVPVDSALGRHADLARALAFAPERQCVLPGLGHMALLSSPVVAARLRDWLQG